MTATVETYEEVHKRLRAERGLAREQGCAHCGQAAAQWAYGHTDPNIPSDMAMPYTSDIKHYVPLCIPCHKKFDRQHRAVKLDCAFCGSDFQGIPTARYCSAACRTKAARARADTRTGNCSDHDIDAYIRRMVDAAPPLSDRQKARLAAIFASPS